MTAIPVVPAIDPDVAEIVPDAPLRLMPVNRLLVTVAESSGRVAVALLMFSTGPPTDCRVATPAATATPMPVPAPPFSVPVPVTCNPGPLDVKISRSVNARSPETLVMTMPAPPTGFASEPTAVVPPATCL